MTKTRYLLIWSPLFEKGHSRHEAISLLKGAWAAKAPVLVTRRTVELKSITDPDILRQCSEWLETHWGKHLKHHIKTLSVITIRDPVWQEEDGEERCHQTVRAMQAGEDFSGKGKKPQTFYLAVERESL